MGAWHKTHAADHQINGCIDARYQSNNYGARDVDFDNNSVADYVLIGDSFAEGYGVNREDSIEFKLEKLLNINIYNFGAAGNFGPLQYYLIYKKLAKNFNHKRTLVFFLPANDFLDNDRRFWVGRDEIDETGAQRYRPYWKLQDGGNFSWFYPESAVKRECYNCPSTSMRTFLIKYSYIGNIIRTLENAYPKLFNYSKNNIIESYSPEYSGYFDANELQQKAAMFYIEKIILEASPQDIKLVVIPDQNDLIRINNGANYQDQYWYKSMVELRGKYKNFKFLDLATHSPSNYKKLFLPCDGHWSSEGHTWAAKSVRDFVK